MFGMRAKRVAQAVSENSSEYGPGSAAWSPEQTPGLDEVGLPSISTQQDDPFSSNHATPIPRVPEPPSPSTGGEPGRSEPLGYSTGILPSRALRQRFGGQTLVVPSMGAHPAEGPVGVSNRQGRLQAGVNALVDQWLPSQQAINESFTHPRNRNPLDAD